MNALRLNLGCADLPMHGYINIDKSTSERIRADITADVTELHKYFSPGTVDEIYSAHLVEHLTPLEAEAAFTMWVSLLKPGGMICVVTPDFRWMAETYLSGITTIADLNDVYIYSYCQESLHQSVWDIPALTDLFTRNELTNITEIDRLKDERLAFPALYQCGVQGFKP